MNHSDIVAPRHYKRDDGQLECFEAFRQMYGNQAALHACMFNATKYIFRHDTKGCTHQAAITDLDKAIHYLESAKRIYSQLEEEDL